LKVRVAAPFCMALFQGVSAICVEMRGDI
jgi:hypothetical protein